MSVAGIQLSRDSVLQGFGFLLWGLMLGFLSLSVPDAEAEIGNS